MQIAIVVAEFNTAITGAMLAAALDEAAKLNATVAQVVRVPGSYELPLPASRLLDNAAIQALVVLGYIEKGETLHGEVMGHVVSQALLNASLASGKPVGFGIIGPGAVVEQAELRKDSYARAAVRAAIHSIGVMQELARAR